MPRTKEYDRDCALDAAMRLFWERGYEATSLDSLTGTMGLSRSSFYAEFESKHQLFLAALQRYSQVLVTHLFGRVEQAGAALGEIAGYFDDMVALTARHGLPGPGCLMANSMAELVFRDPEVRALVLDHFQRLEKGFAAALRRARTLGQLRAGIKPARAAHMLAVSVQGFSVYSRLCDKPSKLGTFTTEVLRPLATDAFWAEHTRVGRKTRLASG